MRMLSLLSIQTKLSIRVLNYGMLILSPQLLFASGGSSPISPYQKKSLKVLASRGGVDAQALESFFNSLQTSSSHGSSGCMRFLEAAPTQRDSFLSCLSEGGKSSLTKSLGEDLFNFRSKLLQKESNKDNISTLALAGYVEDLVRENLRSQGKAAVWVTQDGFKSGSEKLDFEFEDGDVVVGLGKSSISSLISQINQTPSRYSHAFLVRKREGKVTTVESLIETGVKEFPLQHLLDDPYNQLTVLRWKNPSNRKRVASAASDWAYAAAKRRAPYDIEMNFDEDHALYCSEVILKAYSHASGLDPRKILAKFSSIKSKKAFEYAQNLGVRKQSFASPGDLFNSEYLEVVADYRKPKDLLLSWELFLMGDLFLEKIEEGYKVQPDPIYTGLPLVVWVGQLIPSIFHEDARLIPKSLSPWAMSVMATTQKKIYDKALELTSAKTIGNRSLLNISPWAMRGAYEQAMDESFPIKSSFSIPKKRKPRMGHPGRR